jgi:hypothetical protein
MTVSMNGTSSVIYVVRPLGTLITSDPAEAIAIESRVSVDGREVTIPFTGPPPPGAISGIYVCDGDALHLTPIDVGVPHPGLEYTRLR